MLEKYEDSPADGEIGRAIAKTPEAIQEDGQLSFLRVASLAGRQAVEVIAEPPAEQMA